MRVTLLSYWKNILSIGDSSTLNQQQKMRLHTINAFAFSSILIVLGFTFLFVAIGSYSALEGLPIVLVMLIVLWLNSKRQFETAKFFVVFFLAVLLLVLALSDRRTGTEYLLITVACSSILIFDSVFKILFGFGLSLACFAFYSWYDTHYLFVPDPTLYYEYTRVAVILVSVCAVAIQLLVFRSLVNRYADDLEEAHKRGVGTNEELKASNEELHSLSEQLDWIVKQKSTELQSYLDAINVHVYSAVTDTHGVILKVNEPLTKVTGYSEGELLGKNFNLFNSGFHSPLFFQDLFTSLAGGKTWRNEVKNKRKDGSFFWIDMVVIPLKNEKGATNYFLTLALPITERKEAEEKKEKTMKLLEDIAFKASHKVRGPIARIQGIMNLLEKGYLANEEMNSISHFLKVSVTEMDVATRELTTFVNTHYEEEALKPVEEIQKVS
jgi:PAS domain S-box-containing protein